MSLRELLSRLDTAAVRLESPEPGRVILASVFPETHPLTPALVEECRRHKPELLAYLAFEAEADALLLASTHRLAAVWPKDGPVLGGPEWDAFEDELVDAYHWQDRAALADIIVRREAFALDVFDHFRTEAM